MAAEPPVAVVPLLIEPALFPQLVSDLESMRACPLALISPRTVSAEGGGLRLKSGLKTVTWIFCLTLGPVPVLVGVQPVATMFRSLADAPLATDTVKTPIWAPFIMTATAALPS